ncbi:MAG: hypothetical protein CMP91_05045 [Gammaproteobacteria bacterium]|nr:hypothetical protein [Gammaproteobacteria bacterium]MAY02148.1 hypothetical protein [Gammaproteobacteria bacterium]|tara:strand:+ start:1233 stop:2369 length:1137 start_codon:yes stop_codon:yes gene_type:complete
MIAFMVKSVKYTWQLLVILLLLLVQGLPAPVLAIEVRGLYQATVQVDSREDERERRRGFSDAMLEVLVKVSGSTAVSSPASIRRALNSPEAYVESWSTQTRTEVIESENGQSSTQENIELVVNFYESEIQRLLDENNIPLWPVNRPETLVWIVIEDELGERRMLASSANPDSTLLERLDNYADQRGLPLLYPILDLEDQLRLNVNRLWELDEQAILNASRRYQAESILAIRIFRSLSGELLARSLYFFRDNVFSYEEFESSENEFLQGSINLVSTELSQYYAVLLSSTENSVPVDFQVDGIDSPADYSALLSYLRTLEGVNAFQLKRADQGTLILRLETGGQLRQLVETIALEPSLQIVSELNRDGLDVSMHYRWLRD